jgi:dTMP kinase
LNAFAVSDCVPDITFLLDVDVMTARSRMKSPRRPDRMEQEPAKFYEEICEAYRELAKREPNRVVLIDGSQPMDKIDNQIWEIITDRFPALVAKSKIGNRKSKM